MIKKTTKKNTVRLQKFPSGLHEMQLDMLIIWKQERRSVSGCLVVHHSPNHKEGQTEQVRMKQKEMRLMDLVKSADVAVLT